MGSCASKCTRCCKKERSKPKQYELDGLSAPQLSSDKQHLQRLVTKEKASNEILSSRVDDLEKSLHESRDAHERDVKRHETVSHDLNESLKELSLKLEKQAAEYHQTLENLKEENRKAIEDLAAEKEEEAEEMRQKWSEEREEMERETLELRNSINAIVEAKVEELIQPYINSYEENKSLRAVLEMKNTEQHKLIKEISEQAKQLEEVYKLRDHVIRLEQRNEDLQMQVEDKNADQRELRNENCQLSRDLAEQKRTIVSQNQRIDELKYRLSTSTPPPASPFNPVFTPSPSTDYHPSQDFESNLRTPGGANALISSSRHNGTT